MATTRQRQLARSLNPVDMIARAEKYEQRVDELLDRIRVLEERVDQLAAAASKPRPRPAKKAAAKPAGTE